MFLTAILPIGNNTVDVEIKTVIANLIDYIIPDHLQHPHSDPIPQLNRMIPVFHETPTVF
jgi:hypothetical protein